ncbi:MAG: ASCH domain-containing protein [Erysipelotrichaceae bacterium]|nr:ASCH domain-containing protein [Erysipelotrichaceae bacterium]
MEKSMTNTDNLEHWHFEVTEEACNYLLDLVLKGQKRATSSALIGYELDGEDIPAVGDMSVITDWDGNPRCVIRTSSVKVIPYRDITFEIASLEGEDDSLDSWRRNHEEFFREEGKEIGYEFSEDMGVVFEEFEVVEII